MPVNQREIEKILRLVTEQVLRPVGAPPRVPTASVGGVGQLCPEFGQTSAEKCAQQTHAVEVTK
jgi:hypothetical protein